MPRVHYNGCKGKRDCGGTFICAKCGKKIGYCYGVSRDEYCDICGVIEDRWLTLVWWLNEHIPATGQREWLRWVLDSVPEERRLLVALALSVAHWHPTAEPRGGGLQGCALCALYPGQLGCYVCPYDCRRGTNHFTWYTNETTKAADAVFEDLVRLYDEKWRRVNENRK